MITDVREQRSEDRNKATDFFVPRPSSVVLLDYQGGIGIKCETDINNDGKNYDIMTKI